MNCNSMRAFLILFLSSISCLAQTEKNPNFILFLTDDMGWGDLACYGHPVIQTPNLDQFARQGTKFMQCYSASGVCSPSRSAILTGRTPYRNGVWRWIPPGHEVHLRDSEITFVELLKEKNYDTCHVGKWHLNGFFNSKEQPQPDDHGFDHWMATQNNAKPSHKNPMNFVRNGVEIGETKGFSAPLLVEEGIRWLDEIRNPNKPFFLNVWTHEPHLPIESSDEFMKAYSQIKDEGIRQHHGNITQIDHAFGKLMNYLDKMGLASNTFVFFTSDNGPAGNGDDKRTRGSTGGLRGRKRSSYEGGIRVPGIARWPDKIPAGAENYAPIIGSDLFSTFLGIVEVPLPEDRTIDGINFMPLFKGQQAKRSTPLYWRNHLASPEIQVALRYQGWKILADEDLNQFQLYHIAKDWQEKNELSIKFPKMLELMKKKLSEVHLEIQEEGPQEWWENETPRETFRK